MMRKNDETCYREKLIVVLQILNTKTCIQCECWTWTLFSSSKHFKQLNLSSGFQEFVQLKQVLKVDHKFTTGTRE